MSGRKLYARGRRARAECQRSGQKMFYKDLVEDGHIPGLLVHPDWWEPKHPQEIPVTVTDPIALYRPAPDLSSQDPDYGDPEGGGQGACAALPDTGNFPASATLATTLTGGEFRLVLNEAVIYPIGECIFMELDGGGWFVSKSADVAPSPTFIINFVSAFVGDAASTNEVYIGVDGAAGAKTP
jgi:hypothetical protein